MRDGEGQRLQPGPPCCPSSLEPCRAQPTLQPCFPSSPGQPSNPRLPSPPPPPPQGQPLSLGVVRGGRGAADISFVGVGSTTRLLVPDIPICGVGDGCRRGPSWTGRRAAVACCDSRGGAAAAGAGHAACGTSHRPRRVVWRRLAGYPALKPRVTVGLPAAPAVRAEAALPAFPAGNRTSGGRSATAGTAQCHHRRRHQWRRTWRLRAGAARGRHRRLSTA